MPTLQKVDPFFEKQLGLVFILDPFRDAFQADPFGEVDHGAHEKKVFRLVDNAPNKGAVDFHNRDVQGPQVTERRKACAKVIQRDAAT